ncbi:MAG: LuxR C-terminal-related transcriptional regulator [Phycisphaerae bacterium]|nr:LuxR C-terminal-related transcriptional regulator [Phycisphaerae bacterium]
MAKLPDENNVDRTEPLFRRPTGMLLDEKQWLFLKERYHMTPRELQVAILVCRGFNNDEIARALKVRQGTVKTHLRNIYRRVRVRNKVTLLLKFVEDVNRFYMPQAEEVQRIPIVETKLKTSVVSKEPEKTGT